MSLISVALMLLLVCGGHSKDCSDNTEWDCPIEAGEVVMIVVATIMAAIVLGFFLHHIRALWAMAADPWAVQSREAPSVCPFAQTEPHSVCHICSSRVAAAAKQKWLFGSEASLREIGTCRLLRMHIGSERH